jgi:hypothetical protein
MTLQPLGMTLQPLKKQGVMYSYNPVESHTTVHLPVDPLSACSPRYIDTYVVSGQRRIPSAVRMLAWLCCHFV